MSYWLISMNANMSRFAFEPVVLFLYRLVCISHKLWANHHECKHFSMQHDMFASFAFMLIRP